MESICVKFNIQKKENYYNLKSIVENIIQSTNTISYMNKIQEKKKIDKCYYINEDKFIELLKKSKKESCKIALEMIENNQIIYEKPKAIDINFSFDINNYSYIVVDNEIWFKGKDIAAGMGYSDTKTAVIDHVDKEFKLPYKNLMGGEMPPQNNPLEVKGSNKSIKPNTIFISEPGVYALVASSKLPIAKAFQKWLFKEVLPSIRKTGSYSFNKKKDVKLLPDVNEYEDKNCFYLLNIDEKKYKFGISQYIKDRINSHKRELDFNNIVKIWTMNSFDNIKKLEKKVKNLIKQWEIQYNEENQLEWFQINDNISLQDIIDKIDQYIEIIDNDCDEVNNDLLIQKEITKQKKLDIEKENISLIKSLVLNNRLNNLDEIVSKHFELNKNVIDESINNNLIYESYDNETINNNLIDESYDSEDLIIDECDSVISDDDCNKCIDCNVQIMQDSTRCNKCSGKLRFMNSSKDRPSYEQLKEDLKISNYTKVGKKYNVSDNTIRKWIKKYEKYNNI
jgi:prophage antirepressor-like protein